MSLIIVVIIFIWAAINSVYEEKKRASELKRQARAFAYSSDLAKPTIKDKISKCTSFKEYEIILKHINFIFASKKMIDYYDKLITDLTNKKETSRKYDFDNYQELSQRLDSACHMKEQYMSKLNTSKLIINDKSNGSIEFFRNKFNLINNQEILNIFGTCRGYQYNGSNIVFYKHLIILIKDKFTDVICYKYSQLKLLYRKVIVQKNYKIDLKKDQVVSEKWLHSKVNGGPDKRFSGNYKIYKIEKYYMYFDKIEEYGFTLDLIEEKDEYISLFEKIVNIEKKVSTNLSSNIKPIDKKIATESQLNVIPIKDEEKVLDESSYLENPSKNGSIIKLFPKDNMKQYYYHKTFGIGVLMNQTNTARVIFFINGVGLKTISKNYPLEQIQSDFIKSRILEVFFANKYIEYNNKIGKVINGKNEYLVIKYADDSTDKVYVIFDVNLTSLLFRYKFSNEEEYNKAVEQEKYELENMYQSLVGSYVKSTVYNYGRIIKASYNRLTIMFDDYGEKIISATHNSITILSESAYKKAKENLELEKKSINEGDMFVHPIWGICEIIGLNKEASLVKIRDITRKRYIKKLECAKYIENGYVPSNVLCKSVSIGDYIYLGTYGYCRIMSVDISKVHMEQIKNHSLIEINSSHLYFFEKINEKYYGILSELETDALLDYNNDVYRFIGFDYRRIKIINSSTNELSCDISEVRLHKIDFDNLSKHSDILLLEIFNRDYYSMKEFNAICDEYLNKYNSLPMQFKPVLFTKFDKINNFVFKSNYIDIENYLRLKMLKNNIYHYEYMLESQNYNYVLDKLCKEHYCIKSGTAYITQKCLVENGIYKNTFEDFNKRLLSYIQMNEFISIIKIKKQFDYKFLKYITDNQSMIDLIRSFLIYKDYSMGMSTVIFLREKTYKIEYFEKMIIKILNRKKVSIIDVYELIDTLKDEYDILYEDNQFISETNNFKSLFYSEDTEKVYIDKKYYYDEVYG